MLGRKKYHSLEEIFNDEEFHLIEEKKKVTHTITADARLLASFEEINDFISKNGREPEPNMSSVSEFSLYSRLKGLREDIEKIAMLRAVDLHHLLPLQEENMVAEDAPGYGKEKEINSFDDIMEDDFMDLLDSDDDCGLFDFNHTPREINMPDYKAKRKRCKDFDQFEGMLKACHRDLQNGLRKIKVFKNEQEIDKGNFYILKGVLLYVADIGPRFKDESNSTNARLRCIFDNGTESDLLLRSLGAELYKDGRRVTHNENEVVSNFERGFNVTDKDQDSGYIYVLKSKSQDERIQQIEHLYKIGYSSTSVEERIKNASNEPTYLMAEVEYVAGWKCYNMNPQKFEQLLHNFFGSACLELDVFDKKGRRHTPREWFIAPLPIIEKAVEGVINGMIVGYRYDAENQMIAVV